MRAAAFVRYRSGDGTGHVAWAFEVEEPYAVSGSVENHSGHLFTPATAMGYWDALDTDPMSQMRERAYDDVKWIDVPHPDPLRAYATMLWIKTQAYFALHRNCEDDVYDILRSYGVKNLPVPALHWFPKSWFHALPSRVTESVSDRHPEVSKDPERSGAPGAPRVEGIAPAPKITQRLIHAKPKRPTWRRPWHVHFHLLLLLKIVQFLKHMGLWAKHAKR